MHPELLLPYQKLGLLGGLFAGQNKGFLRDTSYISALVARPSKAPTLTEVTEKS